MTLRIMDGFDLYSAAADMSALWQFDSIPGFSTTGGRFGGGSCIALGGNDTIYYQTTDSYVTMGAAIKPDLNVDGYVMVLAADTGPNISLDLNCGVYIKTDGTVEIRGDGGSVKASSSPGVVSAGAWSYIEFSCFIHSTTGTAEVYVDGVSVASGTAIDTSDSGAGYVYFGSYTTANTFSWDDVYIKSSTTAIPEPYGNIRIETLLPDADTATADWTPLSGNGFDNINDALGTAGDGDSSYISATTLNDTSEFTMGDLQGSVDTVHAVALKTRISRDDAATVSVTPYIDVNGERDDAAEVTPADGVYTLRSDIYESQSGSPSAWDEGDVNILKVGFEITG